MLRCLLICVGAVTWSAGCQPSTDSHPTNFGQFIGDVVASWDNDGRQMTLREPFVYVDPQDRRWMAPAGSVVNGASIPAAFWSVIGGPFEGKYRNASVVHDVGCVEMQEPWEDVHRMFYEACRCGGVDELNAKTLYYAVYHFGPRWQPVSETVVEQREADDGQVVTEEVTLRRMARIDPLPPTPEELEQVEDYVAEEDPTPEAIKKFRRDSLRRRKKRRPDRSPALSRSVDPRSERHDEISRGQGSPTIARSGGRTLRNRPMVARSMRISPAEGGEAELPVVTPDEEQWAIQQVRQYIEQQAGEPRPAEYTVERAQGSFRVRVQLLHENEQGEAIPYEGGNCTVRLSRQGKILEFTSGRLSWLE